jgi:hypothetical protein
MKPKTTVYLSQQQKINLKVIAKETTSMARRGANAGNPSVDVLMQDIADGKVKCTFVKPDEPQGLTMRQLLEKAQGSEPKQAKGIPKPVQLESPHFSKVIKLCQDYIDSGAENGRFDNEGDNGDGLGDISEQIVEKCIEAVFGLEVWEYTRDRMLANWRKRES